MSLPAFLGFPPHSDLATPSTEETRRVLRAYCRSLRAAPKLPEQQWLCAAALAAGMPEPRFRRVLADLGILDPDPLRLHGRLRRGRVLQLRRPFRGLPAGARYVVLGRRLQRLRPRYQLLGPDGRQVWWSAERVNVVAAVTPALILLPAGPLPPHVRALAVRTLWRA